MSAKRMRRARSPAAVWRRAGDRSVGVWVLAAALLTGLPALGCGPGDGEGLSGRVAVDGSSTVFPITEAVAEEFQRAHRGVRVTVGLSGTGGGFKKFCGGETDISNASRPIRGAEAAECQRNGVEHVAFRVGWDGMTVVVNPANDWAECMTVEELRQVWQPGSAIRRWNQIRPGWPDQSLILYAPDTDSGTFDYFTEAIVGEEKASRPDYTASADDNVLVMGVAGDRNALGYFGYAYYAENRDRLKAVAIDAGDGCVLPSDETVESEAYRPLSRPMYIYVRKDALRRPEVEAFVEFYLENAPTLVSEVGYTPLAIERYEEELERLREAVAELGGSVDPAP